MKLHKTFCILAFMILFKDTHAQLKTKTKNFAKLNDSTEVKLKKAIFDYNENTVVIKGNKAVRNKPISISDIAYLNLKGTIISKMPVRVWSSTSKRVDSASDSSFKLFARQIEFGKIKLYDLELHPFSRKDTSERLKKARSDLFWVNPQTGYLEEFVIKNIKAAYPDFTINEGHEQRIVRKQKLGRVIRIVSFGSLLLFTGTFLANPANRVVPSFFLLSTLASGTVALILTGNENAIYYNMVHEYNNKSIE